MLGVCLIALSFSGCFQAANKFYLDSDVVNDKRFEGNFGTQTNQTAASEAPLVIKAGKNKHYEATFQEGEHWIWLDAVLFKSGTNLFADISRIADNDAPKRPAVGPSGLDLLRLATSDKTHSVLRVRFVDDGVEFAFGFGNFVWMAISKDPSIKTKVKGEGSAILLNPTEKLRSFLAANASNELVWKNKVKATKLSKEHR